jgi:hypothetical protein
MKKILTVAVLLLSLAVPSFACGPAGMCMENPMYASCISGAQNTKESCNNSAGPTCSSVCHGVANPGTCQANCWATVFSSCQNWYCQDMNTCLEQVCYQN